jgi:hypothetical protein
MLVTGKEDAVFESLDEQIEKSEASLLNRRDRVFRYLGVLAITVVVFVTLYMAVRML